MPPSLYHSPASNPCPALAVRGETAAHMKSAEGSAQLQRVARKAAPKAAREAEVEKEEEVVVVAEVVEVVEVAKKTEAEVQAAEVDKAASRHTAPASEAAFC